MSKGEKYDWEIYKKHLNHFSEEELEAVKAVRESDDYERVTFEQFNLLFEQGVVHRTRKLKKPRNLYLCEEGRFWYLDHYHKRYQYCGYFKNEERFREDFIRDLELRYWEHQGDLYFTRGYFKIKYTAEKATVKRRLKTIFEVENPTYKGFIEELVKHKKELKEKKKKR